MDLNDFLGPDPLIVDLHAENRWDAIDELIDQLVAHHKVKAEHRDALVACIKKREASMTTGIDFGIAIPHASTDLIDEVVGVVGRSRNGIQFGSLDCKPVRLVLLFLVPQGQFQKHLHTLASLAKLLHSSDFRDGLDGL